MSPRPALLALGTLGCLAIEASAQTDLVMYDVGLDIRVGVPASWVLTNAEELITILERAPMAVRKPTLEAFREMAANGDDAFLFRANDPGVRSNSTQMNASVAPAMTIDAFVNPEDVQAVVTHVCEDFADQAERTAGWASAFGTKRSSSKIAMSSCWSRKRSCLVLPSTSCVQ
ncbi:MAG: hypothetical protein OXI46_10425 [Gemmatimonadota bacterium]|nr:hypothetical protein [Gemmatimonadota bacterium]